MKKKYVFALVGAFLLVGCSSEVKAKPNYVEDPLVNVSGTSGNEDIYNNEFTDLYDSLVDAGTSNSTIVDHLVNQIAKREIGVSDSDPDKAKLKELGYKTLNEVNFFSVSTPSTSEEEFQKMMDDYMVDLVYNGGYTKDSYFKEEKFAREQRDSLYIVLDRDNSATEENFGEDLLLTPDKTFEELFPNGRKRYEDYRNRVVSPEIYKRLLTAKYLYNNKYKVLGRAAARNVRVVTLDTTGINDKTAAIRTINNYIGGFLYASNASEEDQNVANYYPGAKGENGDYEFSVEAVANIWKGVWENDEDPVSVKEKAFQTGKNLTKEKLYTRASAIDEDLEKIATVASGHYTLKEGLDMDNSTITDLLSKYTGSYAYPLDWGVTLAKREILVDDIVEDDFFVEKNGLTDLPSSIRTRLFSMNVSNNLVTVGNTTFLMPEKKINPGATGEEGEETTKNLVCKDATSCISQAANLYHYDSESSSYYIVLVDDYKYTTQDLSGGENDGTDTAKKLRALEIAKILGENSSYQKDSLVHYFKEYKIGYHDDDFYSYLETTYPEIFEEDE